MKQQKTTKVTIAKSGGTSVNSYSGKITIAKSWLDKLGIDAENREIIIKLEDDKITIKKRPGS